ncbi:MAG: methylenetetrahydrofolate reductase [Planctomycetota bacterium]
MHARNLTDLFAERERTLSYEFFPPKSERGWYTLEDTLKQLAPLGPDYVSVTYGAGGSTREKTRDLVVRIQDDFELTAVAHLTCVNATRAEIAELLDDYHRQGIVNILALRGDPPKGEERFTPTDGGYAYATELLRALQADGRFSTACAAYPDGHVESGSKELDWQRLLEKFEAGAQAAVTQCFFTIEAYTELIGWLRAQGCTARIIPGIIPIVDFAAIDRFCAMCGAFIPDPLRELMTPLLEDKVAMRRVGMQWTIDFCAALLDAGAPGLHIYALNRSTAAAELTTTLRALGKL